MNYIEKVSGNMIYCYVCGQKSRKQYFDFVNGKFVLVDKCFNPFCKTYNKFINDGRTIWEKRINATEYN